MSLHSTRPTLTTAGTGHPRLHPAHDGHLYAGAVSAPVIRLHAEVTVLGSDPSADVVLAGLAPRHAEIRRDDQDEYCIRALDGPVTVDGVTRPSSRLHTGDLVRCGPRAFSFARDESTDHRPPRHFASLDEPTGWIARWERALFLLTGPGTASRHR